MMTLKTLTTLIVALFLVNLASLQAQTKNKSIIYKDTIELSKPESLVGFDLLDSINSKYDVFITGENHTYMTSNSALWVKTIKYLYKNAGVRNVMVEYGNASGWLINRYIQTGDTSLFNILKKYTFKEYSGSYKALMEFNQTLPDTDRIRLIGLDLERGVYSAVKVMSMLIPTDKIPHDSIDLHIESLIGLATYQDRELFKKDNTQEGEDEETEEYIPSSYEYSVTGTLDLIIENFKVHHELYKVLLDTNYALFEKTIMGLVDVKRWQMMDNKDAIHDYVFREKYIFHRFEEEYTTHGGKYFGQFGRCHATKKVAEKNGCNWFMFKSFASRIRQSPTLGLQDKILTMGVLYKTDDYKRDDWISIQPYVDSLFTHMDRNRLKIYDLKADSSLNNFFKSDFDYVLLNTTYPSKDHPYSTFYTDDVFAAGDNSLFKMTYSYSGFTMDLDNLNLSFSNVGADIFSSSLVLHGFEITTGSEESKNFQSVTYIGFVKAQGVDMNPSLNVNTKATLTGVMYRNTSYFDLFGKSSFIDLMPGFSLGYTRLLLQFEQENTTSSATIFEGSIGEKRVSTFSNPGITWGFSGMLDLNFSNIVIGAQYGIQKDWSKTAWRVDKRLSKGPKTDLSGEFFIVRLGYYI